VFGLSGQDALLEVLAAFDISDQQAWLSFDSKSNEASVVLDRDSEAALVGVAVALGFRHLVRVHNFVEKSHPVVAVEVVKP